MASPVSQKLGEKLQCSICLELFRVPVTLPCGHNFCEGCIDNHRNKQEQAANGAKRGYACPECRYNCERNLELKKNVTLNEVVELVRAGRVRAEGCEVAHVGLCPLHGCPLELYCEDEQRCICCVCSVRQCQRHQRALFEDERSRKQAMLERSLEEAQREAERMEQALQGLEERTRSIKDSSERLRAAILSKFTHLEEALAKFQEQMVAKVDQEELAALGRIEKDQNTLKDHLEALGQHRDRARHLLDCTDHQAFLEEFPQLLAPQSVEVPPLVEFNAAVVVEPMSEILTNTCRLLLEELPASLGPSAPEAPDPIAPDPVQPEETAVKVVSTPVPKCRLRAELLKEHRNLTFDLDTANKYLELSWAQRRAKHGPSAAAGWQERGRRFEPWQVLCAQSYGQGRHYWEVTISNHSVVLGVTYGGLSRHQPRGHKFNIGLDGGSWGLQVREDGYLARHKGQEEKIQQRLYTELGVCLDYDHGLLSFYGLGEGVQLIHSFHAVFTEPLYPVFWLCEGRTVTLCHRDCGGPEEEQEP
ncbi:tripartite motif-containing protein 65 [Numida meleagris]|uniref:tripartite motif-containing protein 65 n=1 Tax=Numida meleagris TaxID=8996 RepID=UPI000B3E1C27|nr:tripartite motif-containing protein 65 [Numida meleagris]XP_021270889.1 tripartite motif-containing protein 65 [Numida meleagris]